MVIRSDQMAEFDAAAEVRFQQELEQYLREKLGDCPIPAASGDRPLATLPEKAVAAIARCGIARARSYGLRTQADLAAFTGLMCRFGPHFDKHPLVHGELVHPDIPDAARLAHLCAVVNDAAWAEVRQSYKASSWPEALREMGA